MAICELERNTPRTCTPENAAVAITGDKQEVPTTYVADLAINPVTGQADFSNSVPILPQVEDNPQLRENMKQLLDMIIGFFEKEELKVESESLKEEDMLLAPYDIQTDDTNTKYSVRQLSAGFNRRRA